MDLHSLENEQGARRQGKRLGHGRSSGRGKTCGRGQKGQMARKGHKRKIGFEGGQMPLIRRIPKRGAYNKPRHRYAPVNVEDLSVFEEGAEVSPELLKEHGLAKGPCDGIKVLGQGELNKKLVVKAHQFSETARTKIENAGGVAEKVGKK